MKLAAIDIGSNAARLLITDALENGRKTEFIKLNLIRVPLRLGFDVFEKGRIGEDKQKMILNTMSAFKNLLDAYNIQHIKACATSAMRDAANSKDIIAQVKKKTGIEIEIISGDMEAGLVFETHIAEKLDKTKSYLYIDVGGGSTELIYFNAAKQRFKKSFNIGTIRLLRKDVTPEMWIEMKEFIDTHIKTKKPIYAIGSGGNINKIFSISKKKEGTALSFSTIKSYLKEFSALTVEQRIKNYKFKEDRADVIVPALEIFNNVMRWADATEIYVPKIGVADGLIHSLYEEVKAAENKAAESVKS